MGATHEGEFSTVYQTLLQIIPTNHEKSGEVHNDVGAISRMVESFI
jgi:hypothetical protein